MKTKCSTKNTSSHPAPKCFLLRNKLEIQEAKEMPPLNLLSGSLPILECLSKNFSKLMMNDLIPARGWNNIHIQRKVASESALPRYFFYSLWFFYSSFNHKNPTKNIYRLFL